MANRSLIHQLEARERRGRWFPALAGLLSIALLASTWVGLFFFLGANSTYGTLDRVRVQYVPDVDSLTLSLPDLSRVSRVYAKAGELLAELHDGRNSEPVPIDEVPEVLKLAILAAEDKGFYEHHGVSFPAVASAALDNFRSGSNRGGSTITQQIVKKVFVGDEVTIERKIKEAFIAAELERRFDKDRILEFYMNSVYFGSGAYGVQAASREFFGKTRMDTLTIEEAATIAVLVRNPTLYDPRRRPERVLERRNDVIDTMLEQEWITERQAEIAKARPLGVVPHKPFRGPAEHITAEVLRELLDPRRDEFDFLGTTREQRVIAVYGCPADDTNCTGGGGLIIETTIDLDLQLTANELLERWFPIFPYDQNLALCQKIFPNTPVEQLTSYAEANSCAPTGALTLVDNDTGEVVVMASGLPFDREQFDLAVQGRRNPGSAFKPFGLVAALENGWTLGNTFSGASPMVLTCPTICSEAGNTWKVSNAGASAGRLSLADGLARSINTIYAQLSLAVGPEKIVEVAHRMGITSELPPVPSVVLGTGAVSTLDMASAFSSFATNGLWAAPHVINRILDENGNVLYEHQVEREQVIAAPIAAAVRRPLQVVPSALGTAERANIERPQGGKTGTHQDYRDAWYVGFVPQYTAAVWVGFERDQIPLRNVTINGSKYDRVFGGSVPAPIWAEFMRIVLQDVEPIDFVQIPEEDLEPYIKPETTVVPFLVGQAEADAVAASVAAGLNPVVRPIPSNQPAGSVVFQSFNGGSTVEAGLPINLYISNGQPPAGAMPSVVGLPLREAYNTINRFIYSTGVWVDVYVTYVPVTSEAQREIVFTQSAPAGTPMNYKDPVYLTVGEPPVVAPPG
jgi:penicillin-binding protein 1A